MIDRDFCPILRQEIVEPVHGVAVRHALEDVSEVGERLDVVELCSCDERTDGGPTDTATISPHLKNCEENRSRPRALRTRVREMDGYLPGSNSLFL